MSYILDALRKSDEQRQRGTMPTLRDGHTLPAQADRRRPWTYALSAALLAVAAFTVGWLQPWQAPRRTAVASAPAQPVPVPQARPAPPAASSESDSSAALPTDKPADAPAAQRTAQPATRAEPHGAKRAASEHAQPETQRNAAHERAASASGARTAPRAADATTGDAKLPTMDELPASIRQQLPAMAVTVHAYSHAPADRLVGVNDRLLREGDTLAPGLELERITPDGMIFRYNGTRFRYRLP